jgi:hypothetical protein
LVQAFLKKWWVESDFKAPNLQGQQDDLQNITHRTKDRVLGYAIMIIIIIIILSDFCIIEKKYMLFLE